jgi:hypothetical protein
MTQQYQNGSADVTTKSLAQKGETPFRTILEPSQFNGLLVVLRLFDWRLAFTDLNQSSFSSRARAARGSKPRAHEKSQRRFRGFDARPPR